MTNIKQFCCDDETGEILTYNVNGETGEPMVDNSTSAPYFRSVNARLNPKVKRIARFPKGYMTRTKKFQLLKAKIMAGSNTISYRLLLIPTMIIYPGLTCVLLMILEIYLHVKCHKKNKTLKDPTLYFRSPFHAVTSVFCGVCRDCRTASKVSQLQDQRRHRYDYFRGIRGVI